MIPLSVPNLSGNEWKYIKDCLDTNWVSSVGSYVDAFERHVAEFTGARHAVATSSGTTALHLSLIVAGVKPGDRVLVPNLTFVASANAIRHAGAEPVLVDVDADTWQMDVNLVEEFLESAQNRAGVSAIMPVHVLGNMVAMPRLVALAAAHGITIIEDASESLGSTLAGKAAGTFGRMGCLSFNGNKIITTGGGGMILTDDPELARRAKHLSTQAKADAIEFYHDEVAYNYRLVNVLAALGVAQMEQLPDFLRRKREITEYYKGEFSSIPGIGFMQTVAEVNANNWLFAIRHPSCNALVDHLNGSGIQCRRLWVPMNKLPMYSEASYMTQRDVSNELYASSACLPSSTGITEKEMGEVVLQARGFLSQ